MTNHTIGMAASAIFGLLWITFILFIVFVIPNFGIASPLDLSDPNKLLPAIENHPLMLVFPGLDILLGIAIILLSVSVTGRLSLPGMARSLATPFGMVSGALFLLLATNRLVTLPLLAKLYVAKDTSAVTLFHLANASHDGMTMAIRIALSLWLGLLALAVSRQKSGGVLVLLLALCSLVNALGVVFQPVSAANMLLFPILAGFLAQWFRKAPKEE